MTYIDTGCRWVEFLSWNWFLWGHDGLYREGWEQVRFSELPFDSGPPRTWKIEHIDRGKYRFLLLMCPLAIWWVILLCSTQIYTSNLILICQSLRFINPRDIQNKKPGEILHFKTFSEKSSSNALTCRTWWFHWQCSWCWFLPVGFFFPPPQRQWMSPCPRSPL